MWYRITCNSDGSLASCEYHEGAREESGKSVFFVEADSPEQAIELWSSRYKRWAANRAKWVAERREDRRKRGLCIECAKPRGLGGSRCLECRERRKKYRGSKAGTSNELSTEEQAKPAIAEQRRTRLRLKLSGGTRAATLRRVLGRFEALGPMLFREWIVGEIARLEMKARERHGEKEPEAAE